MNLFLKPFKLQSIVRSLLISKLLYNVYLSGGKNFGCFSFPKQIYDYIN